MRLPRRLVAGALLATALAATGSACEYVGATGTPRVGVAGDSIVHETEAALRGRRMTIEETRKLLCMYEQGLTGYTYLERD